MGASLRAKRNDVPARAAGDCRGNLYYWEAIFRV